jgi:hypothetical protein
MLEVPSHIKSRHQCDLVQIGTLLRYQLTLPLADQVFFKPPLDLF